MCERLNRENAAEEARVRQAREAERLLREELQQQEALRTRLRRQREQEEARAAAEAQQRAEQRQREEERYAHHTK